MELHIEKDTKALSASLAEWINNYIQQVLAKQDRFTFVLSGGSTPKALYALLAESPYKESIPWEKLHFFWGDERAVPFEDSRNNAKMCYDELLNKVPVKAENIHIMRTDITPEESAAEYERIVKTYFEGSETTFDFVLLGMGDDGHTLSLFPGTEVIHEQNALATSFFLQAQDMYRITLTAPVVNDAACVAFLAAGAGKAEVLKQVLKGDRNVDLYPSQIIQPVKGQLHWFVDEAAAALL
ncbi:6-phosphogluconolactonase [Dyadobacter sp. BE34]|uniref:6-phosphogluconolactonase n=1 Tax=Dyadobacter fermentans TaxID=94254 RepID=A0ABU1QST1_9BACT|nr:MULTISPECIES: 6-phosphogluconolactonase [Dyadobacter]MDR6804187.1 6-phosphogluconolactonase [Dyadobacter fermentans]MDR7041927.1 6-phosphogluconolactonase [Dyadobacter sp. BE242]MDR7196330.1 6-phosphogluconolactonase [Dyadobacter sp. BE34]MDR7213125.1 6-phosphogluconolactonase [Dyadobacter sp. BE31]MDR7261736.1 6-phosphogluconolactonase [Dyadobacter sp. BE32]